jgi:uncharacterized protein with NRDE domain
MCVLAFDLSSGTERDERPLLRLLSNRDEYFDRPTLPAHWWTLPEMGSRTWVFGGRDLRAGGSWLALNRMQRVAVLTNFRDPTPETAAPRSRGDLVEQWLHAAAAKVPAEVLAHRLAERAHDYAGFNLLLFDLMVSQDQSAPRAWSISNRSAKTIRAVSPGIHGLSNALLDSPWPKSEVLKQVLRDTLGSSDPAFVTRAMGALQDRQEVADAFLPATGIALDRERRLSSVFVCASKDAQPLAYGTRASTVLSVSRVSATQSTQVKWVELTHDGGASASFGAAALANLRLERRFSFPLQ